MNPLKNKKPLLVSMVFLFSIVSMINAETKTPDFAYPATVSEQQGKLLETAIKKKNYNEIVKSVMLQTVAKNLISTSNAESQAQLIDSLASLAPSPYSNILYLLEADLITDVYSNDMWKYNQRNLPLDSFPTKFESWSKDLFALKAAELVNKAIPGAGFNDLPISDFDGILSFNKNRDLLTNISQFICFKGNSILSNFSSSSRSVIPFRRIGGDSKRNIGEQVADLRESLLKYLLSDSAKNNEFVACKAIVEYSSFVASDKRLEYLNSELEQHTNTPYSHLILSKLADYIPAGVDSVSNFEREYYKKCCDYLDKYSDSPESNSIKNIVDRISMKSANVRMNSQFLSTDSVKLKLTGRNENKYYLLIFKMPENTKDGVTFKSLRTTGKLQKVVPIESRGEIPFISEKELNIGIFGYGTYAVIPSSTESLSGVYKNLSEETRLVTSFVVSDLSMIYARSVSGTDKSGVYVVDARNMQPLEGVTVNVTTKNNYKVERTQKFITDKNGFVKITDNQSFIELKKGKDFLSTGWAYFYRQQGNNGNDRLQGEIFDNLSIYHPGDSVSFSVITYREKGRILRVEPNCSFKAVLSDANGAEVASAILTSDAYGRASHSFLIPKTGLLGNWSLRISEADLRGASMGYKSITVADYKLPSFYVEVDSVENRSEKDGEVEIIGHAKTYTGMPVADAEVKFDIRYYSWWLWRGSESTNSAYASTTKTDKDGKFILSLSTEGLQGTPYSIGSYKLNIAVTSRGGETQEASPEFFSMGISNTIEPQLPSMINKNGNPNPKFDVFVKDILNKKSTESVNYEIFDLKGNMVERGNFISPVFSPQIGKIESGEYKIKFSLTRDSNVTSESSVVIYSDNDKTPPVVTPLWINRQKIFAVDGKSDVIVKFGSSYKDSWILCRVYDCEKLIESKWVKADGEMTSVNVASPVVGERTWVQLIGMHDLQSMIKTVEILPSEANKKLKITTQSFRDKIQAGAFEKWTFKLEYNDKSAGVIPVMAVMTDKAINAISPFVWQFDPESYIYYPQSSSANFYINGKIAHTWYLNSVKYLGVNPLTLPEWNTYGFSLCPQTRYYYRAMNYAAAGAPEAAKLRSMATSDSMAMKGEVEEAADDLQLAGESGAKEEEEATPTAKLDLRDESDPVAFFRPNLLTDVNGILSLDFTVPNYNTTWQLQLFGYKENMKTAHLLLDAVSSKPVMVDANVPRFLRYGDIDNIGISVYNNQETSANCQVNVKAMNSLTGEIICSKVENINLDSKASEVVYFKIDVPESIEMIDLIAIVESGDYSDGEINRITVLPSSSPIIESIPFYLGTERDSIELKLPKLDKEGRVTLQYCSNPIWYAILSLPSMYKPEGKSLLPLLTSYYSSTVAAGLIEKNPEVKNTISELIKNASEGKDSVLYSGLQKNDDLKIVDLINTIWTNDASDESLRMLALSKYLNECQGSEFRNQLLDRILDLQNGDGGWSWCPGMKSSYFMTYCVLEMLSSLNRLDYLSSDKRVVNSIVKGLSYCDRHFVSLKYDPSEGMLGYLFVKCWLPANNESSAFAALKNKALNKIQSKWKSYTLNDKAMAAMLFKEFNRLSQADQIIKSIKQFAIKDKNGSLVFDNLNSGYNGYSRLLTTSLILEAMAYCDPGCLEVDLLRQSLIYMKETEDWSRNPYTVNVVEAILSSGTQWNDANSSPTISINGNELLLPAGEKATGYFRTSLSPEEVSDKTLEIRKNGSGPSWGSVISQYYSPIKEIKNYSVNDLSISKRVYVVSDSIGSTTLSEKDLKVGMKVRVMLEITAGKDMNYVAVTDERGAYLEPTEQLSSYTSKDGLFYYKEVRNVSTNFFITFLPKGTHIIYYDCYVAQEGDFSLGIATAQSLYAPQQTSHSAGSVVRVGK